MGIWWGRRSVHVEWSGEGARPAGPLSGRQEDPPPHVQATTSGLGLTDRPSTPITPSIVRCVRPLDIPSRDRLTSHAFPHLLRSASRPRRSSSHLPPFPGSPSAGLCLRRTWLPHAGRGIASTVVVACEDGPLGVLCGGGLGGRLRPVLTRLLSLRCQ